MRLVCTPRAAAFRFPVGAPTSRLRPAAFAVLNREYVAGTNHESHVENIRVRAIKR